VIEKLHSGTIRVNAERFSEKLALTKYLTLEMSRGCVKTKK